MTMNDNNKDTNDSDNDRPIIVTSSAKSKTTGKKQREKMSRTERWDEMYQRLLVWRKKHGHCIVPNRYSEDRQLGTWVSTQRRHYKALLLGHNTSLSMTPERAQKLAEIGFDWSAKNKSADIKWESQFANLLEYVVQHGHPLVPIGWAENIQLANWISTQRQEYKAHKKGLHSSLTKNRIKLLNSIGFIWEAPLSGLGELRKLLQNSNNSESEDGSTTLNSVQVMAKRILRELKKVPSTSSSTSFSEQKDLFSTVLWTPKGRQEQKQQQQEGHPARKFLSNHKKIDTTDAIVEALLCKDRIKMEAEGQTKASSPSSMNLLQLPGNTDLPPNMTSPFLNLNSLAAAGLGGYNSNNAFPRLSVQYQPVLVASAPGMMTAPLFPQQQIHQPIISPSLLLQQQQHLHQPIISPSLLLQQQQQNLSLLKNYKIPNFSEEQKDLLNYRKNHSSNSSDLILFSDRKRGMKADSDISNLYVKKRKIVNA